MYLKPYAYIYIYLISIFFKYDETLHGLVQLPVEHNLIYISIIA